MIKKAFLRLSLWTVLLLLAGVAGHARTPQSIDLSRQHWYGDAVSYSGYRAGQHPDKGIYPTQAQVEEDLRLLARNWKLIRVYGSDRHSEDVLKVIREKKIDLGVMLGMWLNGKPEKLAENERQIKKGIELANKYRDIVVAVNVGNEILVSWSDHKLTEEQAIQYVQRVKKKVRCPVTIADDTLYWSSPDAKLAKYVDFITLHTYPLWGKEDIDTGLSSTIRNFERVRAAHPGKTIVFGEVGWATYTKGDLHVPRGGDEQKQKRYFGEITDWAKKNNVTTFFFEAFDEPWKGEGTEGHWGLFSEGRKAKLAMHELYPELVTKEATSPSYDEVSDTGKTKAQ